MLEGCAGGGAGWLLHAAVDVLAALDVRLVEATFRSGRPLHLVEDEVDGTGVVHPVPGLEGDGDDVARRDGDDLLVAVFLAAECDRARPLADGPDLLAAEVALFGELTVGIDDDDLLDRVFADSRDLPRSPGAFPLLADLVTDESHDLSLTSGCWGKVYDLI